MKIEEYIEIINASNISDAKKRILIEDYQKLKERPILKQNCKCIYPIHKVVKENGKYRKLLELDKNRHEGLINFIENHQELGVKWTLSWSNLMPKIVNNKFDWGEIYQQFIWMQNMDILNIQLINEGYYKASDE